jgi:glucan phosphoethanolaminetransferase (alkaline phosphatase superfamily)
MTNGSDFLPVFTNVSSALFMLVTLFTLLFVSLARLRQYYRLKQKPSREVLVGFTLLIVGASGLTCYYGYAFLFNDGKPAPAYVIPARFVLSSTLMGFTFLVRKRITDGQAQLH